MGNNVMKILLFILLALVFASPCSAENYLMNGGQESKIQYEMVQKVQPSSNTRKLILNYVVPESFDSPTYRQKIEQFDIRFSPSPDERAQMVDARGNKIIEATWKSPTETVSTVINLTALNSVSLNPIKTDAPFPMGELPEEAKSYLKSTRQVNIKNKKIIAKARELTAPAKTQFDAVQQILTWVVDHMRFIVNPPNYDAIYSFKYGRGNCQNYSHLSAALLRSAGIPVRIINGITLKQPYDIKTGKTILTMKMAQSRHSWIEVYFPDLGWVPFDPQGSELFVSNRFIRVEVGIDNRETENDGLMRWTRLKGTSGRPSLVESIDADFESDNIRLEAKKTDYGPRELLLCPRVEAAFSRVKPKLLPPPPPRILKKELKKLTYSEPFLFGNLEFPENIHFLSARGPAAESPDGMMTLRKNFLVETAEYVTTKGQQYAQTFILRTPIKLQKISLALHKFSNEGQLWIELYKDKKGMPGKLVATSDLLYLSEIPFTPGYKWFDFTFPDAEIKLSPGRYWAALGFAGNPIVNWFYSYGKPVGPQDGTRYKTIFDKTWSRSLSFEFNYRVIGLSAKTR
jgi:hypothetical protein